MHWFFSKLSQAIRRALRPLVPESQRYRWRVPKDRRYWPLFGAPEHRRKRPPLTHIPIQPGTFIEVYWKEEPEERGPVAIVCVGTREILKFDCYGPPSGHIHIHNRYPQNSLNGRIFMAEANVPEQIDRSVFELTTNIHTYLRGNNRQSVRHTILQPEALARAAEQMRLRMLEIEHTVFADRN